MRRGWTDSYFWSRIIFWHSRFTECAYSNFAANGYNHQTESEAQWCSGSDSPPPPPPSRHPAPSDFSLIFTYPYPPCPSDFPFHLPPEPLVMTDLDTHHPESAISGQTKNRGTLENLLPDFFRGGGSYSLIAGILITHIIFAKVMDKSKI